jgi:hypothetical protein
MVSIAAGTPTVVEFRIGKIKENIDMAGPQSIARDVPPGAAGGAADDAAGRDGREFLT